MAKRDTRRVLLDAAAAVVREQGSGALTLDRVAAQAGVSKGGLLYHFPTKDELVRSLVLDTFDQFEHDVENEAGGNWARGYLRTCAATKRDVPEKRMLIGTLGMLAGDAELLRAASDRATAWQKRIDEDVADHVDATLLRLAADGLWYAELIGLDPPTGPLREAVVEKLLELAGVGSAAAVSTS